MPSVLEAKNGDTIENWEVIMKLNSIVVATVATLSLVLASAGTANAKSHSGTARFDNGHTITANIWIQSLSDFSGCGDFSSSAEMTASPNWITNRTKFYQVGFGGVSVQGVSADRVGGDPASLTWTNSNGAKGSYMSGKVCGGFGTIYTGADVTASAYYYGNLRVASAHVKPGPKYVRENCEPVIASEISALWHHRT